MLKWLGLTSVVIVLDQITKQWMVSLLALHEQWYIYPDAASLQSMTELPSYGFNLTMAHNYGAAFSFLANAGGWQKWFFIALAAVMSVVLLVWLLRLPRHAKWEAAAVALVLGGAIGNGIDRVLHGYVIDFIQFYADFLKPILGGAYFPAFNVADSAIFIGAVMLIIDSFWKPAK